MSETKSCGRLTNTSSWGYRRCPQPFCGLAKHLRADKRPSFEPEVLVNRSAPSWLLLLLLCSTLCGIADSGEALDVRLGSLAHWQQGLEAAEEGGASELLQACG